MGIFSQYSVKNAKVSGGGNYIQPGNYTFEVEDTKAVQTRDKGPMFVVDLIVRKSNNPAHAEGSRVNYPVLLAKDWGPGNAKEVLAAMSGLDATSGADAAAVSSEDWDGILEVAVTQPIFKGRLVDCTAHLKAKVRSQGEFTRCIFKPNAETRAALHGSAQQNKASKK
jgi:hypothetical protein